MSCFDLTKDFCVRYIGGASRTKQIKFTGLIWEKLTRSKKNGVLGFQDLHLFNLAMLSRQAWRLLTSPNTLCGQVLKAIYFPNSDILHCVSRDGISYSLRSIWRGADLLKGVIWRIENGKKVKF